jgi:single-strand DNA-binding protein
MNYGHFAGYLGQDAEYKPNIGESGVTNFSLGVKAGYGDREHTLWIKCALWGKRGEKLAQYLLQGTPVTVCGEIDLETFEKRDGTFDAAIKLNVAQVTLQGKPKERGESRAAGGGGSRDRAPGARASSPSQQRHSNTFDDDIPF